MIAVIDGDTTTVTVFESDVARVATDRRVNIERARLMLEGRLQDTYGDAVRIVWDGDTRASVGKTPAKPETTTT